MAAAGYHENWICYRNQSYSAKELTILPGRTATITDGAWSKSMPIYVIFELPTDLTPALVREGLARDVVRLIQERRKELDCQYTDRLRLGLVTSDEELRAAIVRLMFGAVSSPLFFTPLLMVMIEGWWGLAAESSSLRRIAIRTGLPVA